MSQHAAPTISELARMDVRERTRALLGRREDQWFDRKSARVQARELAEILVALANAEGGLAAIGISGGEIEGVDGLTREINAWRQAASIHTEPNVPNRLEQLGCVDAKGTERLVALIEVQTDGRFYQTTAGKVFLRIGDSSVELAPDRARELQLDKGSPPYDGTAVATAGEDDLHAGRVSEYLQQLPGATDWRDALKARGFLREIAGTLKPTVAGLLLFGRAPQAHLPEARMRVLQYSSEQRETGERSNVVADEECVGTLPEQIDAAVRHVAALLPQATRLGSTGRFARVPLLPQAAWQEAIVNAGIHRSYAVAGDHVRIELFPDRLEVTSPGRLPSVVTIANIRGTRYARNPYLARGMTELGYGRELAEGVRRMYEVLARAGYAPPLFAQGAASLSVRFLLGPAYRELLQALPPEAEAFVEVLRSRGRVTTAEAEQLLGRRRPAALRFLHRLAEAGLLDRRGQSPNDPRAYWVLGTGRPVTARRRRPTGTRKGSSKTHPQSKARRRDG